MNSIEPVFKREWIEKCLTLGDGILLAEALSEVPPGYSVYTIADLAIQRHAEADPTVFFTIAVDPLGNRCVLEIDTGRWNGPEIVEKIKSVNRRFQSTIIVENNAAQDFILQFVGAVPIRVLTTEGKADPAHGIQSLATEIHNGKWIIPSGENGKLLHPEISAWVDEMLSYDPEGRIGNRLMASWFACEEARKTSASPL